MNFAIQCVYYPQYQQYCFLNPQYMPYPYQQSFEPTCYQNKPFESSFTFDNSKELEVADKSTIAKVQDVAYVEQCKPALSLTEADLEKYICNVNRKLWNEQEDEMLKQLANQHNLDWKTIAASFPQRNPNQCYGRYRRIIRDTKKRGWSKKEDDTLIQCVQKYGQCWKTFTSYLENRTSKQIRQRYLNSLRPNIVNEDWTVQEDLRICQLINTFGKKWKTFEDHLPGRTENRIKNRYYGHIKKIQTLKTKQNKYKEMRKLKKLDN